jgi:flagellar biosynthesis protein FliR
MSPLPSLALAGARMVPLALVATPLGGPSWLARALTALLLTVAAAPFVPATPLVSTTDAAWVTEPLVGLLLGLMAALPFAAARAAGALVDLGVHPWRWRSYAPPAARAPLGDAYGLLALALFAAVDGPGRTLRAALASYVALPVGAAPSLPAVLALGATLAATAVALAAPALAALLMADLVLALVARVQPALGRAVDAAPLRAAAALLVLAGGVYAASRALAPSLRAAGELRAQATNAR